uniref:TNF family profile domain-containing protein n=1 Tax=Periophthalmus magnuspinnatus TaxID=409849 RepID=A0A3B3ZZX2_9GOBI
MEVGLRYRLIILQIWCGALSVAVIVMATILTTKTTTTNQQKTTQVSSWFSPGFVFAAQNWTRDTAISGDLSCNSCPLDIVNSSINCRMEGLYLVYAQVSFSELTSDNSHVYLTKNEVPGESRTTRIFSVSVMKVVILEEGDSVSLEITGDFCTKGTFWGMIQLQHGGGVGLAKSSQPN